MFYTMDVQELERYARSHPITQDFGKALLEKLTEINSKYEHLVDVLDNYHLCTYDANFLDNELKDMVDTIQDHEETIAKLQRGEL